MRIEEIVKMYQESMTLTALRITGTRQDAEDVWQETIIKIWKLLEKGDLENIPGKITGLIHRTTVNTALDQLRKNKRVPTAGYCVPTEDVSEMFVTRPDNLYDREILFDFVNKFKYRGFKEGMFVKYVLDGSSGKEVAKEFGIHENTVKTTISRAKKSLRACLIIKEMRA